MALVEIKPSREESTLPFRESPISKTEFSGTMGDIETIAEKTSERSSYSGRPEANVFEDKKINIKNCHVTLRLTLVLRKSGVFKFTRQYSDFIFEKFDQQTALFIQSASKFID